MRLPFVQWSIARVPSSQALPGYLVTASHLFFPFCSVRSYCVAAKLKKKKKKILDTLPYTR